MVFYCRAHTGMGFLVLYLTFIVYVLPWASVFQMFWLVAINWIIVHPVYPCPTWCIINYSNTHVAIDVNTISSYVPI